MGVEYEAKFLDVNVNQVRSTLRRLGAVQEHPFRRMTRSAYDLCNGGKRRAFVRVRQEADKVTMTSKIMDNKYPIEYEVELKNTYEEGKAFLDSLGLQQKATQVTYREKWSVPSIPDVNEIVLDIIPGIPTYVEIDCKTEDALYTMVRNMGFDMQNANHGAFAKQYMQYYDVPEGVINHSTPSLTFENIHREILPKTAAQKRELRRVQRAQLVSIKAFDRIVPPHHARGLKTAKKRKINKKRRDPHTRIQRRPK